MIRDVLEDMVADDDIIARVRAVDALQIEAVLPAVDADLDMIEPAPVDRRILAELKAPQRLELSGSKADEDPAEGAMPLQRPAARSTEAACRLDLGGLSGRA
jgi:hypothetical protein